MSYAGRLWSAESRNKHLQTWLAKYRDRAEKATDALETIREIILHQSGPLEINDILGIIDDHDPRVEDPDWENDDNKRKALSKDEEQ